MADPSPAGVKHDDAIPNMALAITDTLSIVSGGIEIAQDTVTELQSILALPINSQPSQTSNDGDTGINIDQAGENVPSHETKIPLIARGILIVGMLTVIADGRTALYKPPSGVVFGHDKLSYYLTLVVIFFFGVAELFTGVWISMSSVTYNRRLWIGAIVLFISIWPLVGILCIGGSA